MSAMHNRLQGWAWLAALAAGLLSGCGARQDAPPDAERPRPLKIVATTGMVGDLVERVAGPGVEVVTLIGEGVDPHLYKPTRGDVARLLDADVVFYSGLLLEGKMATTLASVAHGKKPVVPVAEVLAADRLLRAEDQPLHHDPHLWMDVRLWAGTVEVIAKTLASVNPAGAEECAARAEAVRKDLDRLDRYVRDVIESIPPGQRLLVTAHDAFRYFGRAYGIEVRGIQGISTESEAGLEDINRLVDLLVARKVPAIFVESSVADKNVRALIEGAAARGHRVHIGGTLFSDAMGPRGTYEGTYIGMIDHNATAIARALGGTTPPGGLQARLAGGTP